MNRAGTFQLREVERSTPRTSAAGPVRRPAPVSGRSTGVSPRGSAPTILDVAAAAGVSKSLVSLALGGRPGVKEETRARILRAAEDLGYRRNQWASVLVGGRTQTIGVAVTDLSNAYYTDVAVAIEERAESAGYAVVLAHGRRDEERLRSQLARLLALRVDAVVLVGSWVSPETATRVAGEVPLVVVGRMPTVVPGVDSVHNDDVLGSRLAVEHLVERGHERVLFVARSPRPATLGRRRGYEQAMVDAGLARHVRTIGPQDWAGEWDSVLEEVRAGSADAPTAVFGSNDQAAHHVLTTGLDAGLDVPGALAVVGYDNSTLAGATRPDLTSIDQPRVDMGERAVDLVLERFDGREEDRTVVETPSLVVRGSTGG